MLVDATLWRTHVAHHIPATRQPPRFRRDGRRRTRQPSRSADVATRQVGLGLDRRGCRVRIAHHPGRPPSSNLLLASGALLLQFFGTVYCADSRGDGVKRDPSLRRPDIRAGSGTVRLVVLSIAWAQRVDRLDAVLELGIIDWRPNIWRFRAELGQHLDSDPSSVFFDRLHACQLGMAGSEQTKVFGD